MCYSCKRVFRGLTLTNQYLKVGSFKKKEFGRIKYQLRLILKAFHSLGNAIALLYLLFNYWLVSPDNQPNDQTDYPCNQYDNQPQYATLSPLFGISIHPDCNQNGNHEPNNSKCDHQRQYTKTEQNFWNRRL